MNAYISNDLNMVKALDPERHRIALAREEFLKKGGTIEVLQGPSFIPHPVRHEPLPRVVVVKDTTPKPPTAAAIRQKTKRQRERDERAIERAVEREQQTERARKLAETMTYAQAQEATGLSRKLLTTLAKEGVFRFQNAAYRGLRNLVPVTIDAAQDEKDAERIKSLAEEGLSRTQAMNQIGMCFNRFNRLLTQFNIDYPKRRKGPHPAFFAKQQ
ncbi:hypothetical protein [Pseudomonas sp. dw_612]|uniref:hypothetical protein n=1 Tax=Pseudomonas sp. dw_612 TaxID=2720080 RepID=UPI001BD45D3B|nr:hypothetical protein [Pseudomonas sp. dw_612]